MEVMRSPVRLAVVASLAAASALGMAWNETGHMTIAAIAKANLSPAALKEAERLLATETGDVSKDFVIVSTWADEIRQPKSAPWHYTNFHFRTDGKRTSLKPERENVVVAIERFTAILGDRTRSDRDRAEALRFLIHFVGDVHQPLHATARDSDAFPKGDRGGNDFPIGRSPEFAGTDRPPKNLHSLWDFGCGAFPYTSDIRTVNGQRTVQIEANLLMAALPRTSFRSLNETRPERWARESFEAAKATVYALKEDSVPSPAYLASGRSLAVKRVTLAGYRLADLLNRTLK